MFYFPCSNKNEILPWCIWIEFSSSWTCKMNYKNFSLFFCIRSSLHWRFWCLWFCYGKCFWSWRDAAKNLWVCCCSLVWPIWRTVQRSTSFSKVAGYELLCTFLKIFEIKHLLVVVFNIGLISLISFILFNIDWMPVNAKAFHTV